MPIFWAFSSCFEDGSWQFWWTLTYQRRFLDVIQSRFVVRNVTRLDMIWMKRSSSGVSFCCVCPISGGQLCLHGTIDYSVSIWFMNINMKNIMINVKISFPHAKQSAAFVSGRLLRFNLPKFHPIPVTCWCLLPSDLVDLSWVNWCFTSHATIFQSYMWRHRFAGGLKKK